jgi:preprotein translocase subunit SecB
VNAKLELPLSGFVIEEVYTIYQLLNHKDPGPEETHGQVAIGWDWRFLDPEDRTFEVRLSVTVEPSAERDEYLATHVVGRFRGVVESPSVTVGEFVRLQAPAILLPYVRVSLSSLTSQSFYGTYYLPPINVVELMKDFDPSNTTGARQLEEVLEAMKAMEGEGQGQGEAKAAKRVSKGRKATGAKKTQRSEPDA